MAVEPTAPVPREPRRATAPPVDAKSRICETNGIDLLICECASIVDKGIS